MQLLLIDGSSILSTSFFGSVPREYYSKDEEVRENSLKKVMKTTSGEYTNGVYTMMKTLEKIFKKQKPTHVCVAWDLTRETFRREMYTPYKANRAETRPELKSQFALAQRVLEEMHVPQFAFPEYEADDIIGTLAKKFGSTVPTRILTKDQDAVQLVDEYIRLWLITSEAKKMYEDVGVNIKEFNIPDNVFELTPLYVDYFYKVEPKQIIDRKALEGDKSDNIPGVKSVGELTAIPLIQEFGSVEGIYAYIEDTPEKEIKEFFKELGIKKSPLSALTKVSETELVGKESAMLSKKLATIKCDIPHLKDVQLDSLILDVDAEGRDRIFRELEFESLLKNKIA